MNQPKLSIIVAVHNAGAYLEKCLDSLVNQTLKEIEIILVLDCPTDGSDILAEKFAKKDGRIKLIYNQSNLHTGESRNKGMMIATGKYIGFCDHDDYCDYSMFELLYKKTEEKNVEMVRCNFTCVYENKKDKYTYPSSVSDLSNKQHIYYDVCNDNVSCVIWNHIYKADFLKSYGIKFKDSRTICSEDSLFFIEAYCHAGKLELIPDYLYYHVFHSHNTGKQYQYRSVRNRIFYFEQLSLFLKMNNIDEKHRLSFTSGNVARLLYSSARLALLSLPLKQAISEIRQIRRNELIMENINYLYKRKNISQLFHLKPTIIVFFLFVKLFFKQQIIRDEKSCC